MPKEQVKTEVKASGRHATTINKAKQTRAQAKQIKAQTKARKQLLKDIKEQKKAQLQYNERFEQMKAERNPLDSSYTSSMGRSSLDSLNKRSLPVFTREDSIALRREILYEAGFPPKYQEMMLNPLTIDSALLMFNVDSTLYNPEAMLEKRWQDYMPEDMGRPAGSITGEDALDGLTAGTGLEDIKGLAAPNPNLVSPDAAKALFKQVDPEAFQKAQTDMAKLKKKYGSMPDTRFPEEARKRNSLEGLPLKERIYLGGNISLTSTDPLILDINLQLGYWLNKKWMAGVGITARQQLNKRDSTTSTISKEAHGYSVFSRYDILKQFYAWGEGQRQINRSLTRRSQNGDAMTPIKWEHTALLGIGKEFKIGRVRMTTLILYDFNYRNNDLNSRPLVYRMGVQITKQP